MPKIAVENGEFLESKAFEVGACCSASNWGQDSRKIIYSMFQRSRSSRRTKVKGENAIRSGKIRK